MTLCQRSSAKLRNSRISLRCSATSAATNGGESRVRRLFSVWAVRTRRPGRPRFLRGVYSTTWLIVSSITSCPTANYRARREDRMLYSIRGAFAVGVNVVYTNERPPCRPPKSESGSLGRTWRAIWSRKRPSLSPGMGRRSASTFPLSRNPARRIWKPCAWLGEKMQELIAGAGTTEEEIVSDFKKARRSRRHRE